MGEGRVLSGKDKSAEAELRQLRRRCDLMERALQSQSSNLQLQHKKLLSMIEANSMLLADQPTEIVLRGMLDAALSIIGASGGSVMLLDSKTKRLSIWASEGLAKMYAETTELEVGEGIAGRVAESGQPVLLSGEVDDPTFRALCVRANVKDAVVVPLVANGKTIGVLNVQNSSGAGTFDGTDLELLGAFADQAAIAIEVARHKEEVDKMYLDSVSALAGAVDARDTYTGGHSSSVRDWAMRLGRKAALPDDRLSELSIGALLHDVGKIGIDDAILRKPGRLSADELKQVKMHPVLGVQILAPLGTRHDVVPMIRHHHERYDGTGYPAGLRGEEIPLEARILAIADSFHAMASVRPYRDTLPMDVIISELENGRGTQFDSHLVGLFLECLAEAREQGDAAEVLDLDRARAGDVPAADSSTDRDWGDFETVKKSLLALSERLFDDLESLVGSDMTNNLERQVNLRAADAGLPYVMSNRSAAIVSATSSVKDILESYGEFFRLHNDVVAHAMGSELFDRLLADLLEDVSEAEPEPAQTHFLERAGYAPARKRAS